jgi:hypothetical protein
VVVDFDPEGREAVRAEAVREEWGR